jgi:hypothetical protein
MKKVMTVCGEIPLAQLGLTMPHEHIVCDLARLSGTPDNLLDDLDACKQEVAYFKRARGGTIMDVTTPDIGRNVAALREISEATGIHILDLHRLLFERDDAGMGGRQERRSPCGADDSWREGTGALGYGNKVFRLGAVGVAVPRDARRGTMAGLTFWQPVSPAPHGWFPLALLARDD